MNKCVICGQRKLTKYWLCRECAIKWGCYNKRYSEWPDWVRALVKIEKLYIDRSRRGTIKEILVEPHILERLIDGNGKFLQQSSHKRFLLLGNSDTNTRL